MEENYEAGRSQRTNTFQRKDGGGFLSSMVEIILPARLQMVIGLINLENYPLAALTLNVCTLHTFDFKACQCDKTGKYGINQNQE